MKFILSNKILIKESPESFSGELREKLSFSNPQWEANNRMGYWNGSTHTGRYLFSTRLETDLPYHEDSPSSLSKWQNEPVSHIRLRIIVGYYRKWNSPPNWTQHPLPYFKRSSERLSKIVSIWSYSGLNLPRKKRTPLSLQHKSR